MRNFRKLKVFQMAYAALMEIYPLLKLLPREELNNINDQLRRAATSIPLNIAEGSGAKTAKMFVNQLYYAIQSSNEVEVLIGLCSDLAYCEKNKCSEIIERIINLRVALARFVHHLESDSQKMLLG